MIVNEQKEIIVFNNCNALFDSNLLKAAILWYARRPTVQVKKVFMYGKYPAVSVGGTKLHIHRLIVEYVKGPLMRTDYVHHIDGNKLNNYLENLLIMPASEHQSITNKGRKQSREWIKKRIEKTANAKRGKKYPKKIYENPELLK